MSGALKKTNYHMHSTFCDGNDTVPRMAQAAFEQGFSSVGFSGHAMNPFSSDWHMGIRDYGSYRNAVLDARETYRGRMDVLLGFEADFIPDVTEPTFENYRAFSPDFLIGSVHYVRVGNGYFEADGQFQDTRARIDRYCAGDVKKAVQAYFDSERQMLRKGGFTFIGHCDLVRKQNSKKAPSKLFDEDADWYREELKLTAKAIASAGVCVEINTGAMSRGYLETPYPSKEFLCLLFEHKVPVTFASDAHSAEHIGHGFSQACELARSAGYRELHFLSGGTLAAQPL